MGQIDTAWELRVWRAPGEFDDWAATLLPAGHVLGSAQIFFESDKGTLLYTGDFKLRRGLSSESAAAVHAQTLIMETTYGLPRYKFPPPSEHVIAQVVKFCAEAIEDGETPVLRVRTGQGAGNPRSSRWSRARNCPPQLRRQTCGNLLRLRHHLSAVSTNTSPVSRKAVS